MLTMRTRKDSEDNKKSILTSIFQASKRSNKYTHLFLSLDLHADDKLASSATRPGDERCEIMSQHTCVPISCSFPLPYKHNSQALN